MTTSSVAAVEVVEDIKGEGGMTMEAAGVEEVMVEGHNTTRGQVVGRSSQNKTVNFTCEHRPAIGSYVDVRVTKIFPNSLVGEAVSVPVAPSAALLAHQALNARVPA